MTTVWFAIGVLMALAAVHSYLLYAMATLVRQLSDRVNRIAK